MIIQHNILALNSHRQLGNNNSAVGKNLEKLSSGYRINRAGDDAAGLAISEKMRAQIKGLEVAKRNAQDGVSLVQTAEGALDEVHSMLKRMVELSTQSANGTYDDQSRAELQKEIKALNTEIDRIAEGTNFNDIKLLDGSLAKGNLPEITGLETLTPKIDQPTSATHSVKLATNESLAVGNVISMEVSYTDESGKSRVQELKLTVEEHKDGGAKVNLVTVAGTKIEVTTGTATTPAELAKAFAAAASEDNGISSNFKVALEGTDTIKFTNQKTGTASNAVVVKTEMKKNGGAATVTSALTDTLASDEEATYDFTDFDLDKVFTVNGEKFAFTNSTNVGNGTLDSDVNIVSIAAGANGAAIVEADVQKMADLIATKTGLGSNLVEDTGKTITFTATPDHGGLELQVGDTGEEFNRLTVAVGNMDAKNLGVNDVDISSITGAREAIDKIKAAINKVSSTRSDLGAIQNRLEHTISSLGVTAENMTASESRIRDVDMAREMMMFTQNNVLSQAAQAMLAQANQQPQQILQLLR